MLKNLEEFMKVGSVEEYLEMPDAGSSGGGGTSEQHAAASPPLRRKRKFVPSPFPEPLRGKPHHPARDGGRSSYALAGLLARQVRAHLSGPTRQRDATSERRSHRFGGFGQTFVQRIV